MWRSPLRSSKNYLYGRFNSSWLRGISASNWKTPSSRYFSHASSHYPTIAAQNVVWEENSVLYFPESVSCDFAGQRLFVSDSGHNRVLVCSTGGEILDVIGHGRPANFDGAFDDCKLCHPTGTAIEASGERLWIADTLNNTIKLADLKKRHLESTFRFVGGQEELNQWKTQCQEFVDIRQGPIVVPTASIWQMIKTGKATPIYADYRAHDPALVLGPGHLESVDFAYETSTWRRSGDESTDEWEELVQSMIVRPHHIHVAGNTLHISDKEYSALWTANLDTQEVQLVQVDPTWRMRDCSGDDASWTDLTMPPIQRHMLQMGARQSQESAKSRGATNIQPTGVSGNTLGFGTTLTTIAHRGTENEPTDSNVLPIGLPCIVKAQVDGDGKYSNLPVHYAGNPSEAGFLNAEGAGALFGPHLSSVCEAGNGACYVADPYNHQVRCIEPTTKRVESLRLQQLNRLGHPYSSWEHNTDDTGGEHGPDSSPRSEHEAMRLSEEEEDTYFASRLSRPTRRGSTTGTPESLEEGADSAEPPGIDTSDATPTDGSPGLEEFGEEEDVEVDSAAHSIMLRRYCERGRGREISFPLQYISTGASKLVVDVQIPTGYKLADVIGTVQTTVEGAAVNAAPLLGNFEVTQVNPRWESYRQEFGDMNGYLDEEERKLFDDEVSLDLDRAPTQSPQTGLPILVDLEGHRGTAHVVLDVVVYLCKENETDGVVFIDHLHMGIPLRIGSMGERVKTFEVMAET